MILQAPQGGVPAVLCRFAPSSCLTPKFSMGRDCLPLSCLCHGQHVPRVSAELSRKRQTETGGQNVPAGPCRDFTSPGKLARAQKTMGIRSLRVDVFYQHGSGAQGIPQCGRVGRTGQEACLHFLFSPPPTPPISEARREALPPFPYILPLQFFTVVFSVSELCSEWP